MENQAKMREKLIKVEQAGGIETHDSVAKTIEVNDMYMEAITAKLKILDNIWNKQQPIERPTNKI